MDLNSLQASDIHIWKFSTSKLPSEERAKKILAPYLNLASDKIKFLETPNGKPYVRSEPQIYFNISHSGELAAMAVSRHEVGLDIEQTTSNRDLDGIAGRMMSDEQFKIYQSIKDRKTKEQFFFYYWTSFESLVKALGETQFTSHPEVKSLFIENPYSAFVQAGRWTILKLKLNEGLATAVCSQLTDPKILIYDFIALD